MLKNKEKMYSTGLNNKIGFNDKFKSFESNNYVCVSLKYT